MCNNFVFFEKFSFSELLVSLFIVNSSSGNLCKLYFDQFDSDKNHVNLSSFLNGSTFQSFESRISVHYFLFILINLKYIM